MTRGYVVQRRDTLRKIAKAFYGDPELHDELALYNGIRDSDLIVVGQNIEIPSRRELRIGMPAPEAPPAAPALAPPAGLEQILATFGNIYDFIREDGSLDPRWEAGQLNRASLPFSIPISWDRTKEITRLYCHAKLLNLFSEVFETIQREGLQDEIRSFGGCFNFRSKRTSGKLSTHSWGIAIDLNPETNAQGTPGDMSPDVIDIFRRFGFKWGGEWSGRSRDAMHFQFATGY